MRNFKHITWTLVIEISSAPHEEANDEFVACFNNVATRLISWD